MVVTGDAGLADNLRVLRVHGSKPKYYHRHRGRQFPSGCPSGGNSSREAEISQRVDRRSPAKRGALPELFDESGLPFGSASLRHTRTHLQPVRHPRAGPGQTAGAPEGERGRNRDLLSGSAPPPGMLSGSRIPEGRLSPNRKRRQPNPWRCQSIPSSPRISKDMSCNRSRAQAGAVPGRGRAIASDGRRNLGYANLSRADRKSTAGPRTAVRESVRQWHTLPLVLVGRCAGARGGAALTSRDDDIDPSERARILSENRRRAREISADLYAPWKPDVLFARSGRARCAAMLLRQADVFPKAGDPCLEVGFGSLGWLGELVGWGLREQDLDGIELDPVRALAARERLPAADLRIGDASRMPWPDDSFRLVIASTVFTSILEGTVRTLLAQEITRVLAPGGALLWYDFAVNNRNNPHVRRVTKAELPSLLPTLSGISRPVTLVPPIARPIAPWSWLLASLLEALPPLRTHRVAVLVKGS